MKAKIGEDGVLAEYLNEQFISRAVEVAIISRMVYYFSQIECCKFFI